MSQSDENQSMKDLETLVSLVTDALPTVSHENAKDAVGRILNKYEEQLAAFLISVAKAKLQRVIRLMRIVDITEDELVGNEDRIRASSTKDLLKIWSVAQAGSSGDIDFIKKVVELRSKIQGLTGKSGDTIVNVIGSPTQKDVERVSDLPTLTAPQRDKVRNILESFISKVGEDD